VPGATAHCGAAEVEYLGKSLLVECEPSGRRAKGSSFSSPCPRSASRRPPSTSSSRRTTRSRHPSLSTRLAERTSLIDRSCDAWAYFIVCVSKWAPRYGTFAAPVPLLEASPRQAEQLKQLLMTISVPLHPAASIETIQNDVAAVARRIKQVVRRGRDQENWATQSMRGSLFADGPRMRGSLFAESPTCEY
jgi:hypothetical protein